MNKVTGEVLTVCAVLAFVAAMVIGTGNSEWAWALLLLLFVC